MKILTVAGWIHPDQEGGSFRLVYEVGRRIAANGHQVHVVTQRLDERHPERENLAGMVVHRHPAAARSGMGFYRTTLREVGRFVERLEGEIGFDALYLHHPVATLAANRVHSTMHLPRVTMLYVPYFLEYTDRHTYDPRTGTERRLSPWRRPIAAALKWIDGRNLRRSDRIVVLSDFSRRLVEQHYPDCLEKVVKLPAGVDLEQFRADVTKGEARDRLALSSLGLPNGPAIFFTCRRLEHRMGLVELIEATRRLRDEGRQVRVLIAGRGALADALRSQIEAAHLEATVSLLGFVPEDRLPLYYRAADCFVIPTRSLEGFGLVTAEAFACGTPALGTPAGATPEVIRPFDERLVTEDATADAIHKSMARFLDEVAGEKGLSERCRAYAEARLSWDRLADGVTALLQELVELKGTP